MNLPAILRIASQPVVKPTVVTRAESSSRTDNIRGRANSGGQTFAVPLTTPGSGSDRSAAVVHFGAQALGLAREQDDSESAAPTSEVSEPKTLSEAPEFEAIESQQDSNGSEDSNGDASERQNLGARSDESDDFGNKELSSEEKQQVDEMRSRDREVRQHEQAHKASGAGHTGSIHLEFETGPDGRKYAIAGSVSIDSSGVGDDSEATLRKMEIVQRAALAPADPSSADRQVAAQASRQAQQARAQIAADRYADTQDRLGTQPQVTPAPSGEETGAGAAGSASSQRSSLFSLVA